MTELLIEGAQRLIAEAMKFELISFLEEIGEKLSKLTGIGEVSVKVPRTRDRLASESEETINFESTLIPRYLRRLILIAGIQIIIFFDIVTPFAAGIVMFLYCVFYTILNAYFAHKSVKV